MDITSIIVFDDINDANAYLSYLRKTFEKEFKTKAKDLKVPKAEFSLWLKKLESSKTSIVLTDDRTKMLTNRYKSLYPSAKYFGFTSK